MSGNGRPFMVGEVIPGSCGGQIPGTWVDEDLRVEAVGVDWVVLRHTENGAVHFYSGDHASLRSDAGYELQRREELGQVGGP